MDEIDKLQEALGYHFRDRALLRQALTHPSCGPHDNQRLEFLGDAVLQFLMSDILYGSHPSDQEGSLTHQRALLVCEAALSQVARGLGVGQAMKMDPGEEQTGGRDKDSVLGDAMEAILAASYLDGGLDAPRGIILRHWPRPEDVRRPLQDAKSALQEHLQKHGHETPTYTMVERSGPPHDPRFVCAVLHQGRELARGEGGSKKEAEQAAALRALESLNKD